MARCGASTAPVSRRKDRKKRSSVQLSALLRGAGVVFILQLAFPDAVYLVDAIEGGKELIQACKPALESDHITKVIHDCKRDSEVPSYAFENF